MKNPFPRFVFHALALAALFAASCSAEGPQSQEGSRDGTSAENTFPNAWAEGLPKVLWSFPLGAGFGGPAVRDGEVYVLDRVAEKQDILRCISLDTGAELWNYAYDAPGSISHNGSRAAPTVDDRFVYSVGMMGDFVCVDRKTHAAVWHKNVFADFGTAVPSWGSAQSPSLYNNLVIVAPQAPDAFVAAYDRVSGDLVWKSAGQGDVGYSQPVVTKLAGVEQVVQVAANGKIAGISLTDGATLWSYGGWRCKIPIPYATTLPEDRLFITGGYKAGSVMLQIARDGEAFRVNELAKSSKCGSQIHQAILYQDHLYMNSNSNEREDGMMCLSLDLDILWRTKDTKGLPIFERGHLFLADNVIYNLDGKTGILHLIEPSPEGYRELAQAKILDGKEIWAPMVLVDGRLVVRNQEEMKCLDVKKP